MMLSPPVVSLPVNLLLFLMVDGWALVWGGVANSFITTGERLPDCCMRRFVPHRQ
jgi:hypothetical protein